MQMRLVVNNDDLNEDNGSEQQPQGEDDAAAAPRQKRVRFETPQPQTSMHEDLLNDFDDDDDNTAVRPVTSVERAQYTAWHSSDNIPFTRFV